ncbi:MAG: hypothetical protein NDI63_07350 [Pseudobdellovibrio sp.]|nr:hypothetical protein [Pseudobdellovibrio sp.]
MQKSQSMLNVKMNSKVKSSISALFLTAFMLLTTAFTNAPSSTLEKCLDEQPNEIRECLGKTSKHITLSSCFEQVNTVKSNYLKENVREYCFYHISEFPNLKSCVAKARQFTDAENHDAALFNCYSQFESTINKATCETMSKMFRFPEKGRYLKSNCSNLN